MSQQTRESISQSGLNSDETWLEGTIKIKDNNGNLVQFLPETTFSAVKNPVTGQDLHAMLSSFDSRITEAENTGSLEIMKEEPDASNTQSLANETLIAWYAQPSQEGVKHLSIKASKNPSTLAVVGNTINFTYTIINDGEDYPYENLSITNSITGTTHQIPVLENDPFRTVKITESYTVTESDVLAALANEGNLDPTNTLSVSCSGNSGVISIDSTDNFLNVWKSNLISERYNPFVSISVETDTYGEVCEGETIEYYAIISNNTGTSISNLSISSTLSNLSQTISLDPHESIQLSYTHTTTSAEMFAGRITDTITALGTSFANTQINVDGIINYQLDAYASLRLTYVDSTTEERSTECNSGDSISYKANIWNNGTVTLYSITLHDIASGEDRTIASLAPGDSAEYEFTATFNSSETMEIVSGIISARDAQNNNADVIVKPLRCYIGIPAGWTFKVLVDSNSNLATAIPFSLYNQSADGHQIRLTVDWGDGSTSSLTSSSGYSTGSSTPSKHTYATAGEYTITVDSSDWENTYICSYDGNYNTNSYYQTNGPMGGGQPTANRYACIGYFRMTVSEILTPIPALAGSNMYSSNQYSYIKLNNRIGNPFQSCPKLTSIPSNLFAYLPNIANFNYCFSGCTSLASIQSGLFDNNTAATSFKLCFAECSSIQSIPSGLFDNNTAATDFTGCFSGCTSLASIPSGLFDNNTAATDFTWCFAKCTSLASIPSGLFDNNTAVVSFGSYDANNIINGVNRIYGCFQACTSLTSIPSGLFDNNTAAENFTGCFSGCTSLTSIPSGLFDNNTAAENFMYCLCECSSLTSIPSGLFDNNIAVTKFTGCFKDCSSLASIPSGLFDNNINASEFYALFGGCTSLASIPSGLFDSCINATLFAYCFGRCTSIASIPSGLFDNNTKATDFTECFEGCTSLASIPSGLFDNNTKATTFEYCFYECTSLTSIPEELFDTNVYVTTFNRCFWGCTSLASIPSELFVNNTTVTDVYGCFANCDDLEDFTIHIGSSRVSSCESFASLKNGTTRIVYVPANSTTYSNFSSSASYSGLTIIGE